MSVRKTKPKAFGPPPPRRDGEHGHLYETPDGLLWGATTFINVIEKPFLKFWYANQQGAYVAEAAANIYEDAPVDEKMSRLSFLATLKKRTTGVKAAHREMEKAQDIGTQAHALVEWTLRNEMGQSPGPRPAAREEAEWSFRSWETWRASVNLEPIWIEQIVWSKKYQYAGTIDLIARLDLRDDRCDYGRVVAVVDWKTSKKLYPESNLQNAAYAWAYKEMGHARTPPPGLVVRLPKTEKDDGFETKVVHSADFKADFAAFLHAKELWNWCRVAEAAAKPKKAEAAPPPPVVEVPLKDCPF